MTLDCAVVRTDGGAPAMLDRSTGEVMHPRVGPRIEVERLYIAPSRLGLRLSSAERTHEPLRLLDVGLGAGSNAIAAWQLSEALPHDARRLEIVSFDRSVQALELALQPEHASAFGLDGAAGIAARTLLEERSAASARTHWRLVQGELPATLLQEPAASADLVFWDPFSPRANPSLWTLQAFASLFRLCRPGATVHTYSAATSVRSALLLAGFAVGAGDEVGTGKHGTCAALRAEDLAQPLDRRFVERLRRSSAAFPVDAPADALERIAALAQFRAG